MKRLHPEKLHVTYLSATAREDPVLPRRYTLTHSDVTGELFLSIGSQYKTEQISGLYTRLMRDEVLAELSDEGDSLEFRVYCHVSGGFVLGWPRLRYRIFKSELPLVLEAIRYGDKTIFDLDPKLDNTPVFVHFQYARSRSDRIKQWGVMANYV
jgi:hypothetical protein